MKNILTHNFTATYQEGIVSQVDPKTHRVKCKLPALEELETAWLAYLVPNAGGNQFYCLPDVGELVSILLDARGEAGCVLGAIYNEQDPTPVSDGEMWLHQFRNGTRISHHRQTGEIVVSTKGRVVVNADTVKIKANQMVVEAAQVSIQANCEITGNLSVSGNIQSTGEVNAPTISSNGISLSTHKHTEQGDGAPVSLPF